MKLLLLLILSTNLCLAESVKVVKKGEPVPFDGVLFTKELEKDIRNDMETYKKKVEVLTKIDELNNKEIDILSKRLEVYQKKSLELAEKSSKLERDSYLKNAGYFLSGALLTGFLGYAVIQAYR
jgi:hypothetical protein